MTKHRFTHDYSTPAPEVAKAAEAYIQQAQKRRRMIASRPPIPEDLPEGVEVPNAPQGVVATFFRKL